MFRAWIRDREPGNEDHEHKTDREITVADLAKLGIGHRQLKEKEAREELDKFKIEKGLNNEDESVIQMGKGEVIETSKYFQEHFHAQSEVRYAIEGSGYFDVRSKEGEWIRMVFQKGDFIYLPAGIYHRFTPDTKVQFEDYFQNYIRQARLFSGKEPAPQVRPPAEDHPVRKSYLSSIHY